MSLGALAVYKFMPLMREMEGSNAMMRKAWMRYPMMAGVFGAAYFCGLQMPVRFFQKISHRHEMITNETYYGRADLVGRFRAFENQKGSSEEDKLLDHLAMYDKDPLSKPELLDHMMKRISETADLSQVFQIKRQGKDKNPFFWQFGKIHGLENIAHCDAAELEQTKGNPVALQRLINKVNPEDVPGLSSYDEVQQKLQEALSDYKASVEKLSLYPSDKKKMLAMPFYLAKRKERPTPRAGQNYMDLFEELTGMNYNDDASLVQDNEQKITEFDYEKYLNPELLKNMDTQSAEFKEMVRALNFVSKTRYEALQANKKQFGELQSVLSGMSESEQRAFIHLIKNKKRSADDDILDAIVSENTERELAEVAEQANYEVKNRYRLDKTTMQYADKKRMKVDERSVRDMLRNQHIMRQKLNEEIPNYTGHQEGSQFEHGLLTYLREGAYGELGDLVKEVGIKRDTIPFYNLETFRKYKDNMIHESDEQFKYLMSALFTPLDMTDYETDFVGWNELPGAVPLERPNWLMKIAPEPHPQIDALAAIEEIENIPRYGTSPTMKGLVDGHYADVEEEEEEFYGSEGGDDDDYGEEGDEEEGGEEDYGDYDEEDEDDVWPAKETIASAPVEDRLFRAGESLRGKYSEVEIEQFMKLLGVKPRTQWQDNSNHHYKLGIHNYEDEA